MRGEGRDREGVELVERPVAGERDHEESTRELGHEGEHALLELGRGLNDRNDEADDERDDEEGSADLDGHGERVAPEVEDRVARHAAPRSSDCTTRCQPSIMTKTRSLIGSATTCGGTMTMPSEVRIVAATRSMIRNGRRIVRPILNARRSSESRNAGMAILSGTSSIVAGRGPLETS